jgi:hypothetical protein
LNNNLQSGGQPFDASSQNFFANNPEFASPYSQPALGGSPGVLDMEETHNSIIEL